MRNTPPSREPIQIEPREVTALDWYAAQQAAQPGAKPAEHHPIYGGQALANSHRPDPLEIQTGIKSDLPQGVLIAEFFDAHQQPHTDKALANAQLFANAAALFDELKAAHQIIRNALNLMTPKQKLEWASKNENDNVIGEGTTRANERDALFQRICNIR